VLGEGVELEVLHGIGVRRAREVERVREEVLRLENVARKVDAIDLELGMGEAQVRGVLLGLRTKLDIAVVVKAHESAVSGVGAGDRLR